MDEVLESFRSAGRMLFSLGLVRDAEGNLSTFDGSTLCITRTGTRLNDLGADGLVSGALRDELPGASTDLEVHRRVYDERGPGAVVHAHPPGSVPEGTVESGRHGIYVFGPTLTEAAENAVRQARELAGAKQSPR